MSIKNNNMKTMNKDEKIVNYSYIEYTSFLLHPPLHARPKSGTSYTMSTGVDSGRPGPIRICDKVYAAVLSMRKPSFFMLMAALWSRSMLRPHSHDMVRILKSFITG